MRQLILGGARSGKSCLAESRALEWAERTGGELLYVATANADDDEMARRIQSHQSRRDARWQLREEPLDLAGVLLDNKEREVCVLVDCLTLWLSNCLHMNCWAYERDRFLEALEGLKDAPLSLILVGNEVGSGIVPMGELSRQFVDASGWLHQTLTPFCETVTLVVAGLPLALKDEPKT
ncbi:bifunctional adenosylcobinamide kinase/adenosylcobinamide-phosphate guanylyltransferase [Marinimicrobium locisalis]|uniref:bifunctional adenosylcobinamide kinase/adenosylcobinamide-phosphate guanylyltransferase n=1 Tax=Marinimicrobium locisalis TaxID=546022 RepID=UPI0032216D39